VATSDEQARDKLFCSEPRGAAAGFADECAGVAEPEAIEALGADGGCDDGEWAWEGGADGDRGWGGPESECSG